MAGMLPGVEAARRRRFHHRNLDYGSKLSPSSSLINTNASSRRSTFCLYAISSYVFHSNSSMRMMSNIPVGQQQPHRFCDDNSSTQLCAAAREAKKRLDERLQPQMISQTKRVQSRIAPHPQQRSSSISLSGGGPQSSSDNTPKAQATKPKKKNWLKLMRWKSMSSEQEDQDECAVCLEPLRGGETLMQLPCGHSFHNKCLVPWLDANIHAHCPCCRMEIPCHFGDGGLA